MDITTRRELIGIVDAFQPRRLMVVGDLMLDHYIWGKVERISPEAPIPIIQKEKEEFRLGGAANVAVNISALNCEVFPVGLVGDGASGRQILQILQERQISTAGILTETSFQTIVKQRVLTHQQQLLRIDHEGCEPIDPACHERLAAQAKALIVSVDGVILSDYAKGVLSPDLIAEIIAQARARRIPIVCDPGKGMAFSRYRGVTAIKPNRQEAEQLTHLKLREKDTILQAAAILRAESQAGFLALSLDKDGILLYYDQNHFQFIETEAREVFDVTGAGDMVIAVIGALLANGVDPEPAIRLANAAAELEISHLGVVPIPWTSIRTLLQNDGLIRKMTTLPALLQELDGRREGPIVFTNGYFDNISAGHLRFLLEIGQMPGRLIVAINSDRSIAREKGTPPLLKEQDRARLLASLETVHRVVIFDDDDASSVIRQLRPDMVVKGAQFRDKALPEAAAIQAVGAGIAYIRHFDLPSSLGEPLNR